MRVLLIALLVLLAPPLRAQTPRCALLEARVSGEEPIARRGPLRNAFGRYLAGQHAAAAKAFDKEAADIASRVAKLFHAPRGTKVPNEKIRRFLQDLVTGKNPVLRTVGDDFVYVPAAALAWADSRCKTGDVAGAAHLLDALEGDPDSRVAPARAVVAMELGDADRALALLGEPHDEDSWHLRAVRAQALGRAGRLDEAWAALDAARERCIGEVACAKVELVRTELLAHGAGRGAPGTTP
ncbi:MAG: hypothetical protein AMXMBFR64_32210 [Myxococcales bacterium]